MHLRRLLPARLRGRVLAGALALFFAGACAVNGATGFASLQSALNAIYNQLAAGITVTAAPNNAAPYTDPSQAIGTSATTLSFAHTPAVYLTFCDEGALGAAPIAINPTGTAALNTAGSHTIYGGGCATFETAFVPQGAAWSVIAGAAGTPLTVWYR
jgi:hypothetical protein